MHNSRGSYSAPLDDDPDRRVSRSWRLNDKIPARLVLYFLSWSGFLVSFMMRNDMNFALVAMISNENFTHNQFHNGSQAVLAGGTKDQLSIVKSIIISSFYWCYVLSQVAGGIATELFGTKCVFGWSQLATAICSILMPFAAQFHYIGVIVLRSIQGFASGLTWPAMYAIVGYWIPLTERSRFMSSFQGFSIGIGLTYPLCGFILSEFSWPYVFYTTGTLGLGWCLLWYLLAFNTPREHPRISEEELNFIELNVRKEVINAAKVKIPWLKIFRSLPAWAIAITTFGRIFVHYVFIVSGPTFMGKVLKFNFETNGFLSGMPFICSYISSVFFCYIADKFVMYKVLNLTNVRKLFTALSQIIPGLLIYCIGYIDNVHILLTVWFIAVIFITASYAGAMANIIDLAPNYGHSAAVLAFCQTIHMSASFISPLTAGFIVTREDSIDQWRSVFELSAIISILTFVVYQIFGTAEIQSWNKELPTHDDSDEGKILSKPNEEVDKTTALK
ncbi:sialin isoform X1 [Drosophila ficusphila]|uniref:sialin isoform X1 n=1 Tax=Drosophila ficusphila TaxID=30025 RepID=UPI001C8A9986|nr:sialin isoform X1 [Drosophila ficusphila]XP_043063578.1 sialin isoform X1 [Drosophila ficusphila]XP_043063579.1 sialin isoform X1 [Drosophila ficusphila]XP_043063580.1 sialin isoform X1 [Drosophila ficusphila]